MRQYEVPNGNQPHGHNNTDTRKQGDLLPAATGLDRILVIGRHADVGVLAGGGSSAVTPAGTVTEPSGIDRTWADRVFHPSSPLQAIRDESCASTVDFLDGTDTAAAVDAAKAAERSTNHARLAVAANVRSH